MKCYDEQLAICKLCHQILTLGPDDSDDDFERDENFEENTERSILLESVNMSMISYPVAACNSYTPRLEYKKAEEPSPRMYSQKKSHLTVKPMNIGRLKNIITHLMKQFYQSHPWVAIDVQDSKHFVPFIEKILDDIDTNIRQAQDPLSMHLPEFILENLLKKIKLVDYFEPSLLTPKKSYAIAKRNIFKF